MLPLDFRCAAMPHGRAAFSPSSVSTPTLASREMSAASRETICQQTAVSQHDAAVSGSRESIHRSWDLSTLILGLLERSFSGIVTRLFVEAIPLPETASFYRSAQQLHAICETDASVQTKLRDIAAVLRSLDHCLSTDAVRSCQPLKAFKSYLQAVLPWLQEVDVQWHAFEMSLTDLDGDTHWAAKAIGLLGAIDRLCSRPALREVARLPAVAECLNISRDMQQLLAKIQLMQDLPGQARPGQAGLNDYIAVMAGGAAWPGRFGEVLQPVIMALSAFSGERPWSSDAGLGGQIEWLIAVLTDPAARPHLQPHLEMILGGPEQTAQLISVLQLSDTLARYPAGLTPVEQARWLVRQVIDSGVMRAFGGSSLTWAGALMADKQVMAVFEAMLDMKHHGQGWPSLMKSISRAALAGGWTLHGPTGSRCGEGVCVAGGCGAGFAVAIGSHFPSRGADGDPGVLPGEFSNGELVGHAVAALGHCVPAGQAAVRAARAERSCRSRHGSIRRSAADAHGLEAYAGMVHRPGHVR